MFLSYFCHQIEDWLLVTIWLSEKFNRTPSSFRVITFRVKKDTFNRTESCLWHIFCGVPYFRCSSLHRAPKVFQRPQYLESISKLFTLTCIHQKNLKPSKFWFTVKLRPDLSQKVDHSNEHRRNSLNALNVIWLKNESYWWNGYLFIIQRLRLTSWQQIIQFQ